MKKTLFAALLMTACFPLFSQMNNVKLGLGSLTQFDVNLKYERAFDDHHAFQIALMWDTPESLSGGFVSSDPDVSVVNGKLSGFAIVPEYRYYFGSKGPLRGFYAGAYLKLRNRNLVFNDDFGTDVDVEAKFNLRNIGGGIGCGYQWIINDAFSIDWNIFGIGAAGWGLQGTITPTDPSDFDEIRAEVLEGIDGFELDSEISDIIEAAVDVEAEKERFKKIVEETEIGSLKTPRIRTILPDFRFGLSVGYAF